MVLASLMINLRSLSEEMLLAFMTRWSCSLVNLSLDRPLDMSSCREWESLGAPGEHALFLSFAAIWTVSCSLRWWRSSSTFTNAETCSWSWFWRVLRALVAALSSVSSTMMLNSSNLFTASVSSLSISKCLLLKPISLLSSPAIFLLGQSGWATSSH